MNLTELFQVIEPRITAGSEYGWPVFGTDAFIIDLSDEISIVFGTLNQKVYSIYYYDDQDEDNLQEIVWVDPNFRKEYELEFMNRKYKDDPDPKFISLEEMMSYAKEKVNQGG